MIGLETIIGSALGAFARLIPEVLSFMDKKNERSHELAMQDKALAFQRLKGDQRLDEIRTEGQVEYDIGLLDVLKQAQRDQFAPSGVKWVDGFNKLIRPLMAAQWVILLWPGVVVASFIILMQGGLGTADALVKVFGPEEKAFASAIANFYIMNRIFDKKVA